MKIVILLAITAAFAALAFGAINAYLTRRALDSARAENAALRSRRDALREEAFELGARATAQIERGRQLARSAGRDAGSRLRGVRAPSRSAADVSIIDWMSSQGAQLESLAVDLSDIQGGVGGRQAAVPVAPPAMAAGADADTPASDAQVKQAEKRPPQPSRPAGSAAR